LQVVVRRAAQLKVAFDARCLTPEPEGIGIYLLGLVTQLVRLGHKVTLLSDREECLCDRRIDEKVCDYAWAPPVRASAAYVSDAIWTEIELPRLVASVRPDIYHAPRNTGIPTTLNLPSVVTVHDLSAVTLAEYADDGLSVRRAAYAQAVRGASRIVCVSAFTRRELLRVFPEAIDKTSVVPNGVEKLAGSGSNGYGNHRPYIAYTGRFGHRKNVDVLVRAFAQIAAMQNHANLSLLLLGSKVKRYPIIRDLVDDLGLADRVIFTGYLPREEMGRVLRDAVCLVYPSRYEGFGFPPLEAMSVGCPVIASDIAALRETIGKAGLLVPSGDARAIVRAFLQLTTDRGLRARLIDAGYDRASRFSWERPGRTLEGIYASLAGR
jgi:glycosyltransferase involved in cell wall biosynthesis